MATQAAVKGAPEPDTRTRGFKAPCPLCNRDDCVQVQLHDVQQFRCVECDGGFSVEDVEAMINAMINSWTKVLAWVKAAPVLDD